jgi:hypothetical protein
MYLNPTDEATEVDATKEASETSDSDEINCYSLDSKSEALKIQEDAHFNLDGRSLRKCTHPCGGMCSYTPESPFTHRYRVQGIGERTEQFIL